MQHKSLFPFPDKFDTQNAQLPPVSWSIVPVCNIYDWKLLLLLNIWTSVDFDPVHLLPIVYKSKCPLLLVINNYNNVNIPGKRINKSKTEKPTKINNFNNIILALI